MQSSIVVVAIFAIACCAAENRKMDEVQYKNHRLSTNDTKTSSGQKYPVYPTQMYANLSNVKDFTTVKSAAEKPSNRATEAPVPQDVVRMFITPATEKKRKQDYQSVATTQGSIAAASSSRTSSSSSWSSSSPSVYLVTAKSAPPTAAAAVKDMKSPVYSRPSPQGNFKETTTTVAEDESKRYKVRYNNGTKTRRVMKTQNPTAQQQQQSHLLYAATTPSPMLQVAASGARDTNAFAITTKVNSSNASKPFTTVLVPKQMLDGDLVQHEYNMHGDSSFRPIVSTYKQNVDANSIGENRRASSVVKAPVVSSAKSVGHGSAAKPVSYKVEEFADGQSSIVTGGGYGLNNNQDRSDQTYVPAEKSKQEQVRFNPSRPDALPKYNSAPNHEVPRHGTPKHDGPVQGLKYGFTAPETVVYEQQSHRNVHSTNQYREFYPATEIPPRDVQYPSYNSAGKFNVRSPPVGEMAAPSFESEKLQGPHKDFTSPPARFAPMNPGPESNGPEFVLGDVNPKYVLKSILRDMLKSKQQSEVKPSPSTATMDEIIDTYFKTSRPNVDFSLDNYDIETDMSCNLRSIKHITDGQCVTTKPVVEAVCADRCLVYATSQPFGSTRQRSSPLANQQVEALHCVDGDVKLKRVQLHCRDGNTVNNVVKVVINCRCKLHQIQPQMRSNSSPSRQMPPTVNPDIMHIAAGKF